MIRGNNIIYNSTPFNIQFFQTNPKDMGKFRVI